MANSNIAQIWYRFFYVLDSSNLFAVELPMEFWSNDEIMAGIQA